MRRIGSPFCLALPDEDELPGRSRLSCLGRVLDLNEEVPRRNRISPKAWGTSCAAMLKKGFGHVEKNARFLNVAEKVLFESPRSKSPGFLA